MGISPLHGSHPAVPFASGATSSHGLRLYGKYETAGQQAGRQGTGRQGQYGTQGLYPWDGYVFHGGKAASWESSPF